ncbi:MAG: M23 family metallopeptidase [Gammaproteobacteria bacterium]|jgi:murein DD-endopeptidase MepM/ murein hydrolase activator NlpD|nr:M23 family metallopeptidase [Gammaproteobacteria bacterium]MBT4493470.1 M23 family metallopeptidase [Gammaproteobacteria bacterium]MBT7370345.1 M23 family metallopeptidase [Gammaproteobacteria bacterium]
MKFIIVDNKSGKHRSFNANGFIFGVALASLLSIPAAVGYFTYRLGIGEADLNGEMVAKWREVLDQQQDVIENVRWEAEHNLEASALRIAQLQARIIRLDALGERLTKVGRLDEGEFDFSQAPAMGGPEDLVDVAGYTPPAYMDLLDQLARDIEDREQQLGVLETLLADRKMQRDVFLAGRPIGKGWMSSRYGFRVDPINGKRAWHPGVDFAGKDGSDVVSVAAGVVVFAGTRSGYGKMVEINHGSAYSTRYGHHKELTVKAGDIVRKGEVIGLMGSSGRSTGPHVHFEVFKNGRTVDPATYIHRASR